jgi:hypothetical protein
VVPFSRSERSEEQRTLGLGRCRFKGPKAEWNKKKKAGAAPSPFGAGITYKSAYTPQGKKGS